MNTATIIPVHPPKFPCAKVALETWKKYCSTPLYFVLSNEEDLSLLKDFLKEDFEYLVIPENLRHYRNPITVKKFYGVSQLVEKYDYVGVFDSEMKVVKPFDTDEIYKLIWNKREFKCNQCWGDVNGGALLHGNAKTLNWDKNEILLHELENWKWYFWFNEICVYEKETFKEFFCVLNCMPEIETIYNEYWCFDYNIYGMWLIAYEQFKCKKLFPDRQFGFGAVEHNQFNFGGVTEAFMSYMDSNMNHENYEHIKVQFHYDRYIPESQKHTFRL